MSQVHDALIQTYSDFYVRTHGNDVNPAVGARKRNRWYQAACGPWLDGLERGSKVLDLGCGTGFLLAWLTTKPNIVSIGVDVSPQQVRLARSYLPETEVYCADGLGFLKERVNTFSAILCFDVLEHIPELDSCYEWVVAARAALKPGGFFVCRVPNAANLLGCYSRHKDLTHVRSFTRTSIIQLLEVGGFEEYHVLCCRPKHLSGRIRLTAESLLHRVVFRIAGHSFEPAVSRDVYGLGIRKATS